MIPGVQGSSFLFLSHSPALAYYRSFLQGNLREERAVANFFVLVPSHQKYCPCGTQDRD